jgi:phenylalanyl-tRNA synthetase beta chain
VRRASEGEAAKTLDGKERTLVGDDLVIADARRPIAIAGVMGGEASEVKTHTTRLLLESATFNASSVRRTARRQGLHSEASHRFERGVDPEGVRGALDRLAEVIVEVAGGRLVGPATVVEAAPFVRARVTLRRARLNAVVGVEVPWNEAIELLTRLGLELAEASETQAVVTVPGARGDLTTEIDLIEEILRVRGFHTVPARIPTGSGTDAASDLRADAEARVREALSAAGFDEAINYAFTEPNFLKRVETSIAPIALRNPIASDLAVMRTTLLAGLLRNVSHNLRRGAVSIRLAELGRAYLPRTALDGTPGDAAFTVAHEPRRLGLVAAGPRARGWTAGKESFDFYDLKGALEGLLEALAIRDVGFEPLPGSTTFHPRSACRVVVDGQELGRFGELHPTLADAAEVPRTTVAAELDLDALLSRAQLAPRFQGIARFPASLRDVAVVVDEKVTAAQVATEIRAADAGGLLEEVLLFDVYQGAQLGPGRKNLAYSLRYRAPDRTLTDEEVNGAHAAIVARLGARFGAELRA